MSNTVTNDELRRHLNPDHTIFYIKELFKNCLEPDPAWMIECRKIGQYAMEDGSRQPAEQWSAAQILQFGEDWQADLGQWFVRQASTAAPLGIGTFMAPALLDDRRATDASVKALVSVCADFDTGNPKQQLDGLCAQLGIRPTFVVESGGTTKEGWPKLHAHWRLDEPCDEPWKVAYIREQLAKRYGADVSFKRIPQVIRVPGALYDKGGEWKTTVIIEHNDIDVSMMQWEELFNIDWNNLDEDSIFNAANKTKSKEEKAERLHQLQTEEVEEGRQEDTRWDRFSEYAGHQIRQARFGHQSEEEAYQSTLLWVNEKMVPAWDTPRVQAEFRALLGKDKVNHAQQWADRGAPALRIGNAPVPANQAPPAAPHQLPGSPVSQAPTPQLPDYGPNNPWLDMFTAKLLYAGEAPKERHLIDNFLVHGSAVGLVADGGVGKTYLAIELALRAAAGPEHPNNMFLGFDILEKMNVIVLTVEDNQHDLHRRICAIDGDGSLREASDNRCMIVPVREQIMDGLTLAEKDGQGNFGPSRAWRGLIDHIQDKVNSMDKDYPLLVIIDTYSATHHSDENSATGTNEWFRASGLLRQFEATMLVTHHIRKTDQKMEIRTPADMKAAIRGSTAFINSLRTIFGVWEMPNSDSVLKELPKYETNQRIFNMGILKNNTGISWEGRSDPRYPDPMITLRRLGTGRLMFDYDVHTKRIELTSNKKERIEASKRQLKAAIRLAIEIFAAKGWPLSRRNLTKEKEQFLPAPLSGMSEAIAGEQITELLGEGVIKQLKIKKVSGHVFDTPAGPYTAGIEEERNPETPLLQWAHYKYDEEHEEYVEIPNAQHVIDF